MGYQALMGMAKSFSDYNFAFTFTIITTRTFASTVTTIVAKA